MYKIIMFIIILILIIKIYFLKKSLKEIQYVINKKRLDDSNMLITVSSNDKAVKQLADCLNVNLQIYQEEKNMYNLGNQELKRKLTNLSHDIRTPLTAIYGYLELLENSEKDDEYFKIIKEKTSVLKKISEELFDYSNNVVKEKEKIKTHICINNFIQDIIASNYELLKKNKITPNIKITEKIITKKINKESLIRIFDNLISNVIKYSEGDMEIELNDFGKIIFSNKSTPLDFISVSKIFDRYYTVDSGKKDSTGLGLAIVKQLVLENNGDINVKCENEKFIVEIEFY